MNFYIEEPVTRLLMFNFYRGKFLPKCWLLLLKINCLILVVNLNSRKFVKYIIAQQ